MFNKDLWRAWRNTSIAGLVPRSSGQQFVELLGYVLTNLVRESPHGADHVREFRRLKSPGKWITSSANHTALFYAVEQADREAMRAFLNWQIHLDGKSGLSTYLLSH